MPIFWLLSARFSRVSVLMLDAMVGYLIVFGVRYSWQIFFLTRLWTSWLLLLRFVESGPAKVLERVLLSQFGRPPHRKQD